MLNISPSLETRTDHRLGAMLNGLGGAAHGVQDSVSAQGAALERRLSAAWDQVRQLEESAARRARWAAATTDDYAHAHPWQLVLAAAAIGFAAGALIANRRRMLRTRMRMQ